MGLNEKQKQLILSNNKDLPIGRKLREMAICWKDRVKVFGLETSLPTKCLFETNPNEKAKINRLHKKHGHIWERTANAYKQLQTELAESGSENLNGSDLNPKNRK